jgi:hypothetical protein
MTRLISFGVFFLVSIFVSSFPNGLSRRDQCSNPVRDTCSFYADCIEPRYHCGPTGYPLNYGKPYCQKFTAAKSKLSAQGKQWVSDTMLCLQTALVPEALGQPTAAKTCSALHDKVMLIVMFKADCVNFRPRIGGLSSLLSGFGSCSRVGCSLWKQEGNVLRFLFGWKGNLRVIIFSPSHALEILDYG